MADSRPDPIPFQYVTREQRCGADRLGMWIFLVTELLLFGSLFTSFAEYAALYPTVFHEASLHLNLALGALDTVLLLLSSLAMALAVRSLRVGRRRTIGLLAATAGLGVVFLGLKFAEYIQHYHEHLAPGFGFAYPGPQAQHAELFFVLYFVMTGLHALHLTIGIILVAAMLVLVRLGRFSPEQYLPLDLVGLYWHFVDIIWVFLYPTLYLIGRH
ncbi:MAG TPA: cytochrome c oxidase subunit 3 [Chloroflexota bacterium]|nr:cytochrome c oxidase subunit 3 [Chloroflexota bacterium]